jgi:hypothetical protein
MWKFNVLNELTFQSQSRRAYLTQKARLWMQNTETHHVSKGTSGRAASRGPTDQKIG